MMIVRSSLVVAALLAASTAAGAQESSGTAPANPVADAVRAAVKRGERNLVGAAQEMPADKFGYKPTSAQMSFGQIVMHVAGSNELLCANISGATRPQEAKLEATAPKEQLIARLQRSFQFCNESLGKSTDANLGETIPFFGSMKATRAAVMVELAADLADHYAAMSGYLRLNGLLPPTARRRAAE